MTTLSLAPCVGLRGRELVPVHSCPYCGCPDVYLADTDGGGRTVACPACGMSGPESVDGDDTEAERGWEILPHGLEEERGMIDSFIRQIIDISPLALKIAFVGIFVSWLIDKAFDDRS